MVACIGHQPPGLCKSERQGHRRQAVLHRQRRGAWRRQERLDNDATHRLLPHRHEGAVELLRAPYDDRMDPHPEALRGGLNMRQEGPGKGVGRVHQSGDVGHGRQKILQQLDALATELCRYAPNPREVAAWSRQARDQAGAHGIAVVARFAAWAAGVLNATMRSTGSRTSSTARSLR